VRITQLPNTCSAFYLSEIAPFDDVRTLVKNHMEQDHAKAVKAGNGNGILVNGLKHGCAYFANVVKPDVVKKLEEAGFLKVSGYYSHRHNRNVTFMMMRQTSKQEWKDGKARFPVTKKKIAAKKRK